MARGDDQSRTRIPGGRLVLRLPNWVGDLVMATPVLDAVVADSRWSDARFLLRDHLQELLADAPWTDRLVTVRGSAEETARYRDLQPDAVLLLSNSFGAAWRALRSGARVRAGSALSARRYLLTHSFVPPTRLGRRVPVPTAHLHRDAAGLLGIGVPSLHPRLWVREAVVEEVAAELAELGLEPGEPYVFCCPGAAFGAAKLWPPEHFAAVLDELHRTRGWRAVVGGGPGEEPLMRAVRDACSHPCLDLSGVPRDLEKLKAQVKGARFVLVGDSGPRWVAAAFDVPCVTVMGPNFPELTASSLEHCRVVRRHDLECSPCLRRRCPLKHHACMKELLPRAAIEATDQLLEGRS